MQVLGHLAFRADREAVLSATSSGQAMPGGETHAREPGLLLHPVLSQRRPLSNAFAYEIVEFWAMPHAALSGCIPSPARFHEWPEREKPQKC